MQWIRKIPIYLCHFQTQYQAKSTEAKSDLRSFWPVRILPDHSLFLSVLYIILQTTS